MSATDAQTRRVLALVRTDTPKVVEAFKRAVAIAAAGVDTQAVIAALEVGNVEGAVKLLALSADQLHLLEDSVRSVYMGAGAAAGAAAPAPIKASFGFNGRSPAAEAYIASLSSTLIQGITDDSLKMARQVIETGLARGEGVKGIAQKITGKVVSGRRVGGFLGLTTQQAGYVDNMAAMLRDPDRIAEYFVGRDASGKGIPRYKLSDRRFDKVVQAAINKGVALDASTISTISAAHRSKALTRRGQDIAKDQVFTAQSAARAEAYAQIAARPDVESVTKRWQHNLSEFPRPDHVAMNGTVIDFRAKFKFDGAELDRPQDPDGGAEHTLGCHCICVYRVNMLRDVKAAPRAAPQPQPQAPDKSKAAQLAIEAMGGHAERWAAAVDPEIAPKYLNALTARAVVKSNFFSGKKAQHYSRVERSINMRREGLTADNSSEFGAQGVVYFHEAGHAIDHLEGSFEMASDKGLSVQIRQDRLKMASVTIEDLGALDGADEWRDFIGADAFSEISALLKKGGSNDYALGKLHRASYFAARKAQTIEAGARGRAADMFMDLIGSVTNEAIGRGHGKAYYKARPPTGVIGVTTGHTAEVFANAFCLSALKNTAFLKSLATKLAPKSMGAFEGLIDDLQ